MDAMQIMRTMARINELDAAYLAHKARMDDRIDNNDFSDMAAWDAEFEASLAVSRSLIEERCDMYWELARAGVLDATGVRPMEELIHAKSEAVIEATQVVEADVVEADVVTAACCGKWVVFDPRDVATAPCGCTHPASDVEAIDAFLDDHDALFGQRLAA